MKKDHKGDPRHFTDDDATELLESAMAALAKVLPPETDGENCDGEHIQDVLYEFHARLQELSKS